MIKSPEIFLSPEGYFWFGLRVSWFGFFLFVFGFGVILGGGGLGSLCLKEVPLTKR